MAIGTMGQQVTVDGSTSVTYTQMDGTHPATVAGKVFKIKVQINTIDAGNTPSVKIFRPNGNNYDVIYNQTLSGLSTGINEITLTTPVKVSVGDMLGYYGGPGGATAVLGRQLVAGIYNIKYGDITTTTAKADWSVNTNLTLGIYAEIMSVAKGGFSGFSPWIF